MKTPKHKPKAKKKPATKPRRQPTKAQRRRVWTAETEVAVLACKRADTFAYLVKEVKAGALSRAKIRTAIIGTWKRFFAAMAETPTDPADVREVVMFWRYWPAIRALHPAATHRPADEAKPSEADLDAIIALDTMQSRATAMLAAVAERFGLDGSPIILSGASCYEVVNECPDLADGETWPELLDSIRTPGPPRALDEIHEATRTLHRIEARLDKPAHDTGEPFYKPHHFFENWGIGNEILRKNAAPEGPFIRGKIRRRPAPGSEANKRPTYWYSERDARKRWPERFSAADDAGETGRLVN